MREVSLLVTAGLAVSLVVPTARVEGTGQTTPARTAVPTASEDRLDLFDGSWDYNAEESVNLATGRPEQSPRGTPLRPTAPRSAGPGRGADSASDRGTLFPPSPEMMRENRELSRDLLEVAETLSIAVSPDTVSITDDLGRELTFPTDGSRHRYRLSASEFLARVSWEGNRLRKDVEGLYGFRMSEVYFLSSDAHRLFVIVRVGDPARGRLVAGFDRVYDRIESPNP